MDGEWIDAIERILSRRGRRRAALRALATTALGAAAGWGDRAAATPCGPPICNGCTGVGESCAQDSQCCSGLCLNNGTCGCRSIGAACDTDAHCCAGAQCSRGTCEPIANYTFWRSWDVSGGNGRPLPPIDVATDGSGHVYAAFADDTVRKFTTQGGLIASWSTVIDVEADYYAPAGIAVYWGPSSADRIYVSAYSDHLLVFSDGGDLEQFWGGFGGGNGELNYPEDVAVDKQRDVYVVEWGNQRVQKFNRRGAFVTSWGGQGSGNGEFDRPEGIAVHGSRVYVADTQNHRVQQFSTNGSFQLTWGSQGSGNGMFAAPSDVTVDQAGGVYVADTDNHRIQKFADGVYRYFVDSLHEVS